MIDSMDLKELDELDIDMGGAEINVIQGAANTIDRLHPRLNITLHKDVMDERQRIIGMLRWLPIDIRDEDNKLIINFGHPFIGECQFRGHTFKYYRWEGPEPVFYFDGFTTEVNLRNSWLPDNLIVYDVGAHIGGWTIPAALTNIRVYAFEPNIDAFNILKQNIELNELDNVELFNMALTNGRPTKINTCLMPGQEPVNSTQQMKLDDVNIGPPDFIKIDVEGSELDVLRGAQNVISEHHPTVLVEPHNVDGHNTMEDVIKFMNEIGGYKMVRSWGDMLVFSTLDPQSQPTYH